MPETTGPDGPGGAHGPAGAQAAGRPARLDVGVVSAGRAGAVVGAALAGAGHHVVAASAVSRASLARAETLLPSAEIAAPDEVVRRADLALLAVPDDVLPGLVRGLAAAGVLRPGQIVAHTSGAHGVSVLAPAVEHGILPLALHPAMTITGRVEDVARLSGACVGVTVAEGDEAAGLVGEALVLEMGAEPVRVPEAMRPLYHAALAHGANHLVTLVRECVDLLGDAGIGGGASGATGIGGGVSGATGVGGGAGGATGNPTTAERVLAPLLSAALDNALRLGDRALTGPVARGDTGTLAVHLDHLDRHAPDRAGLYRALARRTAERARSGGVLAESDADAVLAALSGETS